MAPISLRPSTIDTNVQKLGGPTPRNVLTVCGDALRKSSLKESARPEETDRALLALSVEDVTAGLKSVSLKAVGEAVTRAGNEAFEAAFADDDGERCLFAESACGALQIRDGVQSMLTAARRRGELVASKGNSASVKGDGTEEIAAAVAAVEADLVFIDRQKMAISRMLTGINPERRKALLSLDVSERDAAWWFSSLADAENDTLLAKLGDLGDKANDARPAFDQDSALRRVSLGVASSREAELLDARASSNAPLREALDLARSLNVDTLQDDV